MESQFSRTEKLYGEANMAKLKKARVAVFGIGGVGGYVVEALARSGVGALDLIDHDTIALSNLNRQIIATMPDIGRLKVDVAKERIASINPDCQVTTYPIFYLPETANQIDFSHYDYIVDAIDTVTGKLMLITQADACDVPIISAMGAGNKIHPELFEVADLYKTSVCPLAKVMRRECRKRGIDHLKVVYSKELPIKPETTDVDDKTGKAAPGSTAFTPSAAGLIIASVVVNDLTGMNDQRQ